MHSSSIPYDDPWRQAYDAMPPWVRKMIAMASDPDHDHDHTPPPGRGRRHRHGSPPPFDPFTMMFGGGRGGRGGRRGGPWGRGPRASRGDIRAAILSLLAEEPMHGYQLMQEMSERSGGVWRPSPGSVYPTLSQLEDEGLVEGEKDGGRRVFSLTDDGRAAAEDADDNPWDSVGDTADDHLSSLRDEIASTAGAVMAVATSGDPDHVEAAKEILSDARKALYRLLAED